MSDTNNGSENNHNGGEVTALHDLIAGGVAGSASVVVGHPFDTIKVRLQTSSKSSSGSGSGASSASSGGVRSLFKGMAAPLSTAAVVNAIIFGSYGSATRLWEGVFEKGPHDESGRSETHGTVTTEGAVLIERGERGTHEQTRERKKMQRELLHQSENGPWGYFGELRMHPDEVPQDRNQTTKAGRQDTWYDDADNSFFQYQLQSEQQSLEQEKRYPAQEEADNKLDFLKVFTCGSIAGTVQAFVICPMEHIKCRLQVQSAALAAGVGNGLNTAASSVSSGSMAPAFAGATAAPVASSITNPMKNVSPNMTLSTKTSLTIPSTQRVYKGPLDAFLSITKNYGLCRGLYRGMGVTLWRETPAFGLYFATYDSFKDRVESLLDEKDEEHPIPSHAHAWAASALAGGISGALTWGIIYPFDVIKSRMQTGPLERDLQKGMWTLGRDLVKEHGWQYMFRGLGVTLVRAFPVNAIIFPVYEFVLMQISDAN